jgi:hypothetical protein
LSGRLVKVRSVVSNVVLQIQNLADKRPVAFSLPKSSNDFSVSYGNRGQQGKENITDPETPHGMTSQPKERPARA